MATYEMNGQQYDIPDNIQGAQLEQTLMQLSEETAPEAVTEEITISETPLQEPSRGEPGFIERFTELFPSGEEQAQIARETVGEPALAMGTGIGATIAGGALGALTAPIAGAEKAEEVIKGTQEALTYQPKSEAGQKSLETVGDLIQAGVDVVNYPISGLAGLTELISGQGAEQAGETIKTIQEEGLGKAAGQRTMEITGDPLYAAVAETSPAIVGSLFPIAKMAKKRSALNTKLADKIRESVAKGEPDKALAKYIVSGSGKVKADTLATEAIKQGFDQGVIAAVKGASKIDRSKMSKMVEIAQKSKENPLFAMKNRPSDVAGNSLIERVNHIKSVNRTAGKQVDEAAKALRGKPANFDGPIDNLMSSLDEMGITISKNLKPIFKGSDIEGLKGPEAAISNIVKRLSSGKKGIAPDAHEMHRMKRYIDEIVTYGKEGEGLKGKTERLLKSLRKDIDDTLDSSFPEYNKANTIYADTVGALDDLQDVAGRKMDLFGVNAEKATGTLLRRMMSNAQSRITLVDAVDKLENISKKYGGQFSDDIASQMLFVDELEAVFGTSARTSLAGETAKGVRKGAEVALGQKTAAGAALEAGAAGLEKIKGINEAGAFKSIIELLKREAQ